MGDPVLLLDCKSSMERIHARVDTVEKTAASIETSTQTIKKCVCTLTRIMYGSESGDGIITKVSNLIQKVSGVYKIIYRDSQYDKSHY